MAEVLDIAKDPNLIIDNLPTVTLNKRFGRAEDYIELHIYDGAENLLYSEDNFSEFRYPELLEGNLTPELNMDPGQILRDRGYTVGAYKLVFNIQRKKIINSFSKLFQVKEISPTRTEIRATCRIVKNEDLERAVRSTLNQIATSVFYNDFVLNFGEDKLITCINLNLNKRTKKYELLCKLYEPLPQSYTTTDTFRVAENIVDRVILNVDMGTSPVEDDRIPLRGPNFKIDVRLNNSVPSSFKTYNDILEYNSTSSYEQLLNQLENKEIPEIQYDYIRTVSSSDLDTAYHFDNFVHFSSATERLKNFEYKVKLTELYDKQFNEINQITGPTSASAHVLKDKQNIYDKKEKLIKGFDGYERFLYYNSGSLYSWPKRNTDYPYNLYSVTSSQAKTWLGENRSNFPNYGGQLLSASLFDEQNVHKISNLLPAHIKENADNDGFSLFTDMIGQQFDQVWTHIKHLTEINDTHHTKGISKELVYFQLKSLGLETFDQFENSDLIEYILGKTTTGNVNFYNTGSHSETLVTSSNAGSVPKGDISKAIWKRLYHNAPYLLKTKGTERGIKALMSCYGVPATLLNVKEYGGATSDKTTYKTFSYEKSGLALNGNSGAGGYFAKTNWSSSLTNALSASTKTVEFRIKPHRSTNQYHLFGLSSSFSTKDPHLVLTPYTGNDILSFGDSTQYGKLDLYINNAVAASTNNFPVYNGDVWNIHIKTQGTSGSASNIAFGAYQSNFNKNVFKYTSSISQTEADRAVTFGDAFSQSAAHIGGAQKVYFGGVEANGYAAYNTIDTLKYSGSIQEIRYYFGENLNDDTFKKHALEPFMYAGNSISSSYDNLIFRLPLGSNDEKITVGQGSYHPNADIEYLPTSSFKSQFTGTGATTQQWEEIIETHHLPTPDTVGASMTSEKVRRDTGTIDDDILSIIKKSETSTLDRQPQDFEDLGVFFSPTTELNEDIVYQLGAFRLDDYIGSPLPSAQTSSVYSDLKDIRDIYFKRVKRKYNYWDYTKLIQYIDHTLFKIIEQWVPMKANLKTGLLIEPHYLERNKFARDLPTIGDNITMTPGSYNTIDFQIDPEKQFTFSGSAAIGGGSAVITTNNLSPLTGSDGFRKELGTNCTIDIDTYILDEKSDIAQAPIKPYLSTKPTDYIARKSSVLLGNAVKGKTSRIYYRSLDKGKELEF